MRATIYHNPQCGTSRKTLALLEEAGASVEVIEYLKHPPSRAELERLYERAGMSAHPILINRPLVETAKGVRLCRPQELVREIL